MNDSRISEINDEVEYKFILLGDTSVGKTCLFKKITSGIFLDKNVATIGIDLKTIKVKCDFNVNGEIVTKNVLVSLTDTSGQERFKALAKSYYKGSDAALLLYDITNKKTFNTIQSWIQSITNSMSNTNNNKYSVFLIGTKIDLIDNKKKEREVTEEEAKNKCKEYKIEWGGEISNKNFSPEKFKEIFKEYLKIIYNKIGFKIIKRQSIINLGSPTKKKKKNKCPC